MLVKAFRFYLVFWVATVESITFEDQKSISSISQGNTKLNTYSICNDTATSDPSGVLQSPNYASYYTQAADCYFYIEVSSDSIIKINVDHLYFPNSASVTYLAIYNSTTQIVLFNVNYGVVNYTYTLGNIAKIRFYIFSASYRAAFHLTWETIQIKECQGPDILFLLDRSQAIFADYYNTTIKNFLRNFTSKYTFSDQITVETPFSSRFGIIEFSDNATVSVPLKQYKSTEFLNLVANNVGYGDGGDSNVTAALLAAYNEFVADGSPDNNGYHVPRLFVLIVNDISPFGYNDTLTAMNKLKKVVQFPTGIIVPGIPGILPDAQKRLAALIGNANYTFGSLDDAVNGIPTITDSQKCPLCSNLIFICEMTVAVGYLEKIQCLKLAQKLAAATADNEKKKYAIATYGVEIYHNIELQNFYNFNATINKMIDTVTSSNLPNGGQTNLAPILNHLYDTLNSNKSKAVTFTLIMGELSAIRDPSPAMTAAKKVATLGTDIYVLDESRIGSITNLWPTLTNGLPNHVVNGSLSSDIESLFGTFNATLLQDHRQIQC